MPYFVTSGGTRVSAWNAAIESSKLACGTGGHCTNYPTWPLPRTNPRFSTQVWVLVA